MTPQSEIYIRNGIKYTKNILMSFIKTDRNAK